jgi:hypothetical protein
MNDEKELELMDDFLRNAVFYPASGLDGTPVKFLAKRFQRFFYADYSIERDSFEQECRNPGFKGYCCTGIDDLDVEALFGCPWQEIRQRYQQIMDQIDQDRWAEPFVARARFELRPEMPPDHGPRQIELILARCEAIVTYDSVFCRRRIRPQCLAYICSGLAFGGNFGEFPQYLNNAVRANSAGLPDFFLYDESAANRDCGDYIMLVDEYQEIERFDFRYTDETRFGGNLRLCQRLQQRPL